MSARRESFSQHISIFHGTLSSRAVYKFAHNKRTFVNRKSCMRQTDWAKRAENIWDELDIVSRNRWLAFHAYWLQFSISRKHEHWTAMNFVQCISISIYHLCVVLYLFPLFAAFFCCLAKMELTIYWERKWMHWVLLLCKLNIARRNRKDYRLLYYPLTCRNKSVINTHRVFNIKRELNCNQFSVFLHEISW